MTQDRLRFDGRVAIVTGGGRGLGRAYARLLAERGCYVVVNDLGTETHGDAPSPSAVYDGVAASSRTATLAAKEIEDAGGSARADCSDVSSPEGAKTLVETALDAFGRIDIIVNNAGISWARPFAETDLAGFQLQWSVHLGGSFNVIKAAWSHLVKQRYGRVVNISSIAGLYGSPLQTEYSAAKGAVQGLTLSLAQEGEPHGIQVNAVAPVAMTRLVERVMPKEWNDRGRNVLTSDIVAPLIAWLAHELSTQNGRLYQCLFGRVAEVHTLEPIGLLDEALTIEKIRDHIDRISSLQDLKTGHAWNSLIHEEIFPAGQKTAMDVSG
jgi:NAD(P)-dependent dehydrogenase (short-subunit alcohol dehydrogenase family)